MNLPALICPIESVVKASASAAWSRAYSAAIDAGLGVWEAQRLANAARDAKTLELAPLVAAYHQQHDDRGTLTDITV